jgi:hypothetical protein
MTLNLGIILLTALMLATYVSFEQGHFYTGVTLTLVSVLTFSGLCVILEEKKDEEEDHQDDE